MSEPDGVQNTVLVALRSLRRAGDDAGDEDVARLVEGVLFLRRFDALDGAADLVEAACARVAAVALATSRGEPEDDGAAGDPAPGEMDE